MSKKILIGIFDYLVITVGVVLFVMAWQSFLLPNNMIDGGLTGASALLSMVTGISVDIWYFGINVLLLILAWFILGLQETMTTMGVIEKYHISNDTIEI